jgi:hypothetical protein
MRKSASLLCLGLLTALLGCGLNEIKDRRQALQSLLATNAPLAAIESSLGVRFSIERRGPPTLSATAGKSTTPGTLWQQRIEQKRRKSAAVGHTSTISMQTWIFLDETGRLIDFEVGAQ